MRARPQFLLLCPYAQCSGIHHTQYRTSDFIQKGSRLNLQSRLRKRFILNLTEPLKLAQINLPKLYMFQELAFPVIFFITVVLTPIVTSWQSNEVRRHFKKAFLMPVRGKNIWKHLKLVKVNTQAGL